MHCIKVLEFALRMERRVTPCTLTFILRFLPFRNNSPNQLASLFLVQNLLRSRCRLPHQLKRVIPGATRKAVVAVLPVAKVCQVRFILYSQSDMDLCDSSQTLHYHQKAACQITGYLLVLQIDLTSNWPNGPTQAGIGKPPPGRNPRAELIELIVESA